MLEYNTELSTYKRRSLVCRFTCLFYYLDTGKKISYLTDLDSG